MRVQVRMDRLSFVIAMRDSAIRNLAQRQRAVRSSITRGTVIAIGPIHSPKTESSLCRPGVGSLCSLSAVVAVAVTTVAAVAAVAACWSSRISSLRREPIRLPSVLVVAWVRMAERLSLPITMCRAEAAVADAMRLDCSEPLVEVRGVVMSLRTDWGLRARDAKNGVASEE